MGSRRLRVVVLVGAFAATMWSCSSSGPTSEAPHRGGSPLPPPSPVVEVKMVDYAFEFERPLPAGHVVFRARNAGSVPHRLALLPLDEDVPPIDIQLKGSERRVVAPFASIYDRRPGDFEAFAVNLVRGRRYAIACFVVDADEQSHALKGMASEFRAGGGDVPSAPS